MANKKSHNNNNSANALRVDDLASEGSVVGGFTPVPIPEGAPKSLLTNLDKVGFTPVPIPGERLIAAAALASSSTRS